MNFINFVSTLIFLNFNYFSEYLEIKFFCVFFTNGIPLLNIHYSMNNILLCPQIQKFQIIITVINRAFEFPSLNSPSPTLPLNICAIRKLHYSQVGARPVFYLERERIHISVLVCISLL